MKIHKLSIEETETGVNLDAEGAPEGIHIEWEILPKVLFRLEYLYTQQMRTKSSQWYEPSFEEARANRWCEQRKLRRHYRMVRIKYRLVQFVEEQLEGLVLRFRLLIKSLGDCFK